MNSDTYLAHIRDIVQQHGWACQGVFPTVDDPDGPSWVYSVGIYLLGHPEFVIVNFPSSSASGYINWCGEQIKLGRTFENGQILTADDGVPLREGMRLKFRSVSSKSLNETTDWFNLGRRFYEMDSYVTDYVPTLQILWPDTAGTLPDEPGFDETYHQELL